MGRARRGQEVDGVLLLDKPVGPSSNQALQQVRRLYDARRAGHTGTLDPLASGLLIVGFGAATRFCGELLDADKAYEATLVLGVRTATGDAEGAVLETRPAAVTRDAVDALLPRFTGAITQVPPMHSALKRDGRPLYDYARAGVAVARAARTVTVHALRVLDLYGTRLRLTVECSKGTYVRTLAEDIGAALGCGAHLGALRRTRIGPHELAAAHDLDTLHALDSAARLAALRPPETLLAALPVVALDAEAAQRFACGGGVAAAAGAPRVRVHDAAGRLLGIGCADTAGWLVPQRVLASAAQAAAAVPVARRCALGRALEPEPAGLG